MRGETVGAMTPGATFHFNDRPGDGHLYAVISRPSVPEVVLVNLTTLRPRSDRSCLVDPGEHPFVTRPTCVAYQYAEVVPTAILEAKLAAGILRPREPLLMRIWEGATITRFLPLRCHQVLPDQGLI